MRALLFLLASAAFASEFDGRWDIQPDNDARRRAWWLEVDGVKGKFVSAVGGDLNIIQDLAIRNGELTFSFPRDAQKMQYRARIEGGKLVGTRVTGSETLRFTGWRAPVIKDHDDGSWKKGKPVALFNGKDLAGWSALVPGQELGWAVKAGVLANGAKANNLVSSDEFWNFELHAEYRIFPHSNSGIGLRGRYEIQILEDYGKPPDSHSHGSLYSRIAPGVNATLPAGQWQVMDVRLVGRDLTVTLNGKKVLDKVTVEGLTAMASDPYEDRPGPIVIQGDHREVEFRKLVVTPLVK
jgi:hypothetical protein